MKVVQLHFVSGWSGWDEVYIYTDMSHEGGYYFIKRDTGNVIVIPDNKVRGEPVIWGSMTSGSIWTVDTDAVETRDRCMDDIRVLEVLWLIAQHFGAIMDDQNIIDSIVPVIRRHKYAVKEYNGKNILTHPDYQEERDVLKEAFNMVRMAIDKTPESDRTMPNIPFIQKLLINHDDGRCQIENIVSMTIDDAIITVTLKDGFTCKFLVDSVDEMRWYKSNK